MRLGMILALVLVFADQISKYLIRHFGGFYICNKGITLGFELHPIFFWIIWLIIIAIVGFQIFNFKFSTRLSAGQVSNKFSINKFLNFKFLGLILVLSGAISNIIDRLNFGCVIDFIDLKIWPIFNPADIFITMGVIILIIQNTKFKTQN